MADYYTKPTEQRLDVDTVKWVLRRQSGGDMDGVVTATLYANGLEAKMFTLEEVFGGDTTKADACAAAFKSATVAEAQAQGLVKET